MPEQNDDTGLLEAFSMEPSESELGLEICCGISR